MVFPYKLGAERFLLVDERGKAVQRVPDAEHSANDCGQSGPGEELARIVVFPLELFPATTTNRFALSVAIKARKPTTEALTNTVPACPETAPRTSSSPCSCPD